MCSPTSHRKLRVLLCRGCVSWILIWSGLRRVLVWFMNRLLRFTLRVTVRCRCCPQCLTRRIILSVLRLFERLLAVLRRLSLRCCCVPTLSALTLLVILLRWRLGLRLRRVCVLRMSGVRVLMTAVLLNLGFLSGRLRVLTLIGTRCLRLLLRFDDLFGSYSVGVVGSGGGFECAC